MAFQRSYSKVWWGSDNPFPAMSLPASLSTSTSSSSGAAAAAGSSFTSGGYYYSYFNQPSQQQQRPNFNGVSGGYHSLDSGYNYRSQAGNLSRIQEVEDEQNISKISWGKRDSPGSLRSQDSGFSDNDEYHSTRSLGGRSTKIASPSSKSNSSARSVGSPTSVRSSPIATPPTVIRRVGKSEFYSPLVNVSRRISFSGSPATSTAIAFAAASAATHDTSQAIRESGAEGVEPLAQLDEMQLVTGTAKKLNFDDAESPVATLGGATQKRRRRVSRKPTKPLTPTKRRTLLEGSDKSDDEDVPAEAICLGSTASGDGGDAVSVASSDLSSRLDDLDRTAERNRSRTRIHIVPAYNNETVYLGPATPPTVLKSSNNEMLSPLKGQKRHSMGSTSTPKSSPATSKHWHQQVPLSFRVAEHEYENPLLNGHTPDLQCWLDDLRLSYEHEVMSTLQTKSIAQEAFKNLTITTNTVAKLIRQLQQRALYMQSDFERMERILVGSQEATLQEALASAVQLVENVAEFTKVLERRTVFFNDSRLDRKRYEENIEQIHIITKDTRYSLERQHYINLESLLDDIHVLKRYLLIALRQVFDRMVRVIVQSVEQGRCDLMLRANINMIATLMNIDYEGFASLTDAFVQNEAVRTLLIVCLEHKLSSVRALALRALATICCVPAAIAQLGACGGIEIVRDILQVSSKSQRGDIKRGDIERREAVSLLTQITAAWHGPEHRVDGLKHCAEIIIEGLTQLIARSSCAQTLLLCAAALNNLSRIEITSHYSIMSNEAIFKLIEAVQSREDGVTIFLYEQIAAMLHNMSLNKKCHSHLANGSIINFITSAYQTEFYKSYNSRAESEAQRRTIKAILHTLTHLVHESSLGVELLEQHRVPAFFRQAMVIGGSGVGGDNAQSQLPLDSSHSRDISMLARQLLQAKRQEQEREHAQEQTAAGFERNDVERGSGFTFNLTRQESFV